MHSVELVGILNATPDSFSGDGIDPNQDNYIKAVLAQADKSIEAGASYIDIGGQSTRPGATKLNIEEEWARLKPILPGLKAKCHNRLSIDTFYPEIVRSAHSLIGGFTINDVTAFNNPEMIRTAAELRLPCIVSHLPGKFGQDIQAAHKSQDLVDSEEQVKQELLAKRQRMIEAGIRPDMIILDPGIGFGKTPQLNRRLLEFAKLVPDIEVMLGFSKKRFLGEHRMEIEPNLEACCVAISAGTRYLRVHNPEWYSQLLA